MLIYRFADGVDASRTHLAILPSPATNISFAQEIRIGRCIEPSGERMASQGPRSRFGTCIALQLGLSGSLNPFWYRADH